MTVTAPRRPAVPGFGWMLICSLWMLPVFALYGTSAWVGFVLIGLLMRRYMWLIFAGVHFCVVLATGIYDDGNFGNLFDDLMDGDVYAEHIPALILYVLTATFALVVNPGFLRRLWELRMAPQSRPVRPASTMPDTDVRPASPAHAAAGEWEAMPAVTRNVEGDDVAAVLTRVHTDLRGELERVVHVVRGYADKRAGEEAAAAVVAAATAAAAAVAAVSAAAPTTAFTPTPPESPRFAAFEPTPVVPTSVGALPRGPLDVLTASVDELSGIPGLGAEGAARLVALRESRTLSSVDEVISGLGLGAIDALRARPYVRIGPLT